MQSAAVRDVNRDATAGSFLVEDLAWSGLLEFVAAPGCVPCRAETAISRDKELDPHLDRYRSGRHAEYSTHDTARRVSPGKSKI